MERDLRSVIRKADDDNEHFLGEVLDENKMATLNEIRDLCRKITEYDKDIKATFLPFSNRSQNGTATLELPSVMFCADKRVTDALSRIFALTDAFIPTSLTGDLRITFVVHDMWSKYGYDNDMEHGE